MLVTPWTDISVTQTVSVAGCLGYDVLGFWGALTSYGLGVSVAGCLGYDVLV